MNNRTTKGGLFFIAVSIFSLSVFGNVTQQSCGDFLKAKINGTTINFTDALQTVTRNNLGKAVDKINGEIKRSDYYIDRQSTQAMFSYLEGIGLFRLGGGSSINCIMGVDRIESKLTIIDSYDMQQVNKQICGPWLEIKLWPPSIKLTTKCINLASYTASRLTSYGTAGKNDGQFRKPRNMASYIENNGAGSINLWVTDFLNGRINHLRYTTGHAMQWVNSIGNFNRPIDIAYRYDGTTPVIYVAEEGAEQIARIPASSLVSDVNFRFFQDMPGNLQESGFEIDRQFGFLRPTGICLNRSGDWNGIVHATTYIYVADAGNEKIYRFKEKGADLQYVNYIALPPLGSPRSHVGIRSDKFGTLYVFDTDAGKVRVYSSSFEKLGEFGSPGDHSSISTDIKFNRPMTGFITEDKLFVVDKWADNSGLQRFDIGGINIVSASVDYSTKIATIVSDNTSDSCAYAVDGGAAKVVNGYQYAGSFPLDLTDELTGLATGRHTLTVSLRCAYATAKTCTTTISFIVDPNANRQPRNIKVSTEGRRIDLTWDEPFVSTGLTAYIVYMNNTPVYQCDGSIRSYSYYAGRDQAGATINFKLGAKFGQPDTFSNVSNFTVVENSLEHTSGDSASANSVQQLTQVEWNSMPTGTSWMMSTTLDVNPSTLTAEPLIEFINSPIEVHLQMMYVFSRYFITGWGGGVYIAAKEGDKIDLIYTKVSNTRLSFTYWITRADGSMIVNSPGEVDIPAFPITIRYKSNSVGIKLSDCTIGNFSTMSSSMPVTLRNVGTVVVDGTAITLDDAVTTAFNGDNIQLSNTQYTLSVPLNCKPTGDQHETEVRYSIALNPSTLIPAGSRAKITYTGPEDLIGRTMDTVQTNVSISGVILKSDNPINFVGGTSPAYYDCAIDFFMQNSIIDAPQIKLIDNNPGKLINSGTVDFDLRSNTFKMKGTTGFVTLYGFYGVSLTMMDNFVYQSDYGSCFCFFADLFSSSTFNICTRTTLTNNTFLIAQQCPDTKCAICDSLQKATATPGITYLNPDYSVTNVNNPVVTRDVNGVVLSIRGANKTINNMQIGSIANPQLKVWPNMLLRPNPNATSEQCFYLPLIDPSKMNISMDSRGNITTARDPAFMYAEIFEMKDNSSFLSKKMITGDLYYAYGENGYGLRTGTYVLSFPGDVVFDEQAIGSFFGAKASLPDRFVGKTSTDATSGVISWNVESLPNGGGGYETQRTESFYEPLPDVTGYESLTFYYKKQYIDQQFSMTFEDASGIMHTIRNTALPSGTRGWYLSVDAANLNWQQAIILFKDEVNVPTGETALSGKLMRLTIHHQSASASTATPTSMLFDNIVFHPRNRVIFDEQDPVDFIGKSGSDGWDGLTSTDAFTGTKSFKIVIPGGGSSSSDAWTGLATGVDLPSSLNKRKLTFAYKKTDPTSRAIIKLYIEDMTTSVVSAFEISEQTDPANIASSGWPIPLQDGARWHQVFIDLFSVRGAGNTDYPSGGPLPLGRLVKIELGLSGAPAAQCLFDDVKFIQELYWRNISPTEKYAISPDYSEIGSMTDWKVNSLGYVAKNTIISYGPTNNISMQEQYNAFQGEATSNAEMTNLLEIGKIVSVSGADFPKAFLSWRERGAPIGHIELSVGCTDGKSYPLLFSPTGYLLNDSRGEVNSKSRWDETETKHSFHVQSVFNSCYPELVNAGTPITPTSVNGMQIYYYLNNATSSASYSLFEYPSIDFALKDATPLSMTATLPVNFATYGKIVPIDIKSSKEIALVRIFAKVSGDIIEEWENVINTAGQTTFTGSCDLGGLDISQLGPSGSLMITIEVTDIFGERVSIDRPVVIDWSVPSVTLRSPVNQAAYDLVVTLDGFSDLPLKNVAYQIVDADGNIIKDGSFDYTPSKTDFTEYITLTDAERGKELTLFVFGTSENGMISMAERRTFFINPLSIVTPIGPVNNSTITWNTPKTELTMCGGSAGIGGASDNFQFYQTLVFGNFEATVGVKSFNPISTAKAGLMARSALTTGSISDFIFTSTSGAYYQYRQTAGQAGVQTFISTPPADTVWFKMKRIGSVLTYYMSTNGSVFSIVSTRTIGTLPVYVGEAYSSGNSATTACATFMGRSIEKLPDLTAQLTLGITTLTKVLPTIVQDGVSPLLEGLSTRNGGQTITIGGVTYTSGIGGTPQSTGAPAFLIYDLESEASRLQVEKIVKLTGIGSTQDGATQVTMRIKASNETTLPSLSEWLVPTGLVNVLWEKPAATNPKNIDVDLTNVKWLGIFIAAVPMYSTRHGVWADLKVECIGSERTSPVITAQPQSIAKMIGQRAVFSVKASGTLPLTYQWQKNHMDIPGATASAYMTGELSLSDNDAVYRCVVKNAFGQATSEDATVTVINEVVDNVPEFALVAKDHLDIRDQVTIVASKIQSNSLLNIGNDGHVTADVLAVGNITVGDRTEVTGNVFAGGTVSLGSGAKIINGTAAGGQTMPSVQLQSQSVTYGTGDVTVNTSATRDMTPGNYRDLHAFSNSTLRFLPGTYNFRKFYLEANVTLVFQLNGSETAIINIDGQTRFGDNCDMSINGTAGIFAIKWYSNYTADEIPIYPDSWIIGQLIMPLSSVHVYSRSIINGLCHAKHITLEPTAGLNYSGGIPSNNQKPVISIPATTNENPVTHASATMSVQAIDDGGTDSLIYQWTAPSLPAGAWVNFSVNNTNASKSTVATFSALGAYTLRATVQDKGLLTDTSSVTLQVVQGTSQITVTPANVTVPVNGTQTFPAIAKDQFGQAMSPQPSFTWTVSGGGSVNASGLFTSNGACIGGPFTVTALSGVVTGVASVDVICTPTNLVATDNSRQQITLTWSDNSSNEGGFAIERAPSGGSFSQIATVGANVTTYANTGLSAGTTYQFRVRAFNGNGNSAFSSIVTATTHANLSLIATATASSEQSGNYIVNAKDNNTSTRWAASTGSMPQWWKVDLGSAKTLNEIEIMFERLGSGSDCNDFKVETSSDNANWVVRIDRLANTNTAQTQAYAVSATARYVRITVNDAPGTYYASMYEFRVFGK